MDPDLPKVAIPVHADDCRLRVALKLVSFGLLALLVPGIAFGAGTLDREELSAALLRAERDASSEFMVNVWQTGDGLPVNMVDSLQQTPDGFLWLGTSHGLVRFDGVRFETYLRSPSGPRYGARIGQMEVDPQGRLWISADLSGLVCYEKGNFSDVLTNGILRSRVESLCLAGDGNLLWVDANGRLGKVSTTGPVDVQKISTTAPPGSRWIRDYKGNIWLHAGRTLRQFKAGVLVGLKQSFGSSPRIAPSRAGGLWIAHSGKLHHLSTDGSMEDRAAFPWSDGGTRTISMLEDRDGRLWVGTVSQGLFCYASGEFKRVVPTASSILCLFEDMEGNVWAGTRGGGLVRVRPRHFFVHDLRSGLANEFVNSLSQGTDGKVWIVSAERGLGWWKDGVWTKTDPPAGARGEFLAATPAKGGGVWISTAAREIWRCDQNQWTKLPLDPRKLKEPAADLFEDSIGRLWMVTDNSGVYVFRDGDLRSFATKDGLPSALIRRLVEDESGTLWAGDWQGGVSKLSGEQWDLVRKPTGHMDAVRSMVVSSNVIWIGTSAGGLLRFKDGKTSRVTMDQGLPDNCIQQLLMDGNGNLWGGTPHRLFRLSLKQLNAVMDGSATFIHAPTYGRGDGLPDTSFSSWFDPRSWRTSQGELWFASANGAIHFNPENLPEGPPPTVVLDMVKVDSRVVNPAMLRGLRPGAGRVEFRYTAPCLTAPDQVRFRYTLTGVDSDWVEVGADKAAIYANIPAGTHEFRVVACGPGGEWGSVPASVEVVVTPFFWQTTWFLTGVAAFVTGFMVWILRRATVRRLKQKLERLNQQHTLQQERTRIAQDIHDELGANLTSIGLLADMGARHKSDPTAVARDFLEISKTARESVRAMDAIVWALNPKNDSLDHFANYLAQFTRDFFRPSGLRTRLDLPADLPFQPIGTDVRHQLFLLVKESFNNIVRHADATEVYISLGCEGKELRLVIADNGRGISGLGVKEGSDGLANLKERIEKLGGALCIGDLYPASASEMNNGSGTRLQFLLPLSKLRLN